MTKYVMIIGISAPFLKQLLNRQNCNLL